MIFSKTLLRRRSVLPGFDLSLGLTLFYLCLIVLSPTAHREAETAKAHRG